MLRKTDRKWRRKNNRKQKTIFAFIVTTAIFFFFFYSHWGNILSFMEKFGFIRFIITISFIIIDSGTNICSRFCFLFLFYCISFTLQIPIKQFFKNIINLFSSEFLLKFTLLRMEACDLCHCFFRKGNYWSQNH